MIMFYNISNHPSKYWPSHQLSLAKQMAGEVVDIPFPEVSPHDGATDTYLNAQQFAQEIINRLADGDVVHIMGEHTFMFSLVSFLLEHGVRCVASTTIREVEYTENGEKISHFHFVAFRNYYKPTVD